MWGIVRDLVNLTLVFGLIYAGLQTILKGIDQSHVKEILKSIIICALLVNFSLIFTKVIIDISNSASVAIYNQMILSNGNALAENSWYNYGVSGAFMQAMGLSTFLDAAGLDKTKTATTNDDDGGFMYAVVGVVFMLIAAFVFFAGAIMLMVRFAVLILLMIFSPILFAASAFKQTSEWRSWWIKSMTDQAIFPPVYLFLLWISYKVVFGLFNGTSTGPGLDAAGNVIGGAVGGTVGNGISAIISSPANFVESTTNNPVLGFIMGAIFLVASLVAAKKAGAVGADMATKFAGRMAFGTVGALGRATVGRRSYESYTKNEKRWREEEAKGGLRGIFARGKLAATQKGAASSYDVRATKIGGAMNTYGVKTGDAFEGGYEAKRKEQLATVKRRADALGKIDENDAMVLMRKAASEEAEDNLASLKAQQRASMNVLQEAYKKANGQQKDAIATQIGKLAGTQRHDLHLEEEKVTKAKEAIERERNRNQIGSAATAAEEADNDYKQISADIKKAKDSIAISAHMLIAETDADLVKTLKDDIEKQQKTIEKSLTEQRAKIRTMRGGNLWTGTSNGYADVASLAGYNNVIRTVYATATGSDRATLDAVGDHVRKEWKESAPERKSKKSGGHTSSTPTPSPATPSGGGGGHP